MSKYYRINFITDMELERFTIEKKMGHNFVIKGKKKLKKFMTLKIAEITNPSRLIARGNGVFHTITKIRKSEYRDTYKKCKYIKEYTQAKNNSEERNTINELLRNSKIDRRFR